MRPQLNEFAAKTARILPVAEINGRRWNDDAPSDLPRAVADVMLEVARNVIVPRFTNLVAGEINNKAPGELVTVVDHEAERQLFAGLAALEYGDSMVGEEIAHEQPELLKNMDSGTVWIVDPIDGTRNFVKGREPFGVIVALACDGVVEHGWMLDPISERICYARQGMGSYVNWIQHKSLSGMAAQALSDSFSARRRRPVCGLATQFMTDKQRRKLHDKASRHFEIVEIPRCAAEHYPRLCMGQYDITLFQRTLPWDHAAGSLFLTEAGGRVSRWDGSDYEFHDEQQGILAACNTEMWELAHSVLICDETGLNDASKIISQPDCLST